MSCAGCKRPATTDVSRYGKLWCAECVAAIDFEERLAGQNRMTVADVVVDARGQLGFVLVDWDGRTPVPLDVGLTQGDVIRELVDAMRSFRRNIVAVGDRIVFATHDAVPSARRLLGVIAKYKPLLPKSDRESTEYVQSLARLVAGEAN